MKITAVEVIHLRVPLVERIREWATIDVPQLQDLQIVKVSTDDPSLVGYGEQPFSPGGDQHFASLIGKTPIEVRGWDWVGRGVQMAIYDLLGQQLEVPVWQLMAGVCVRTRVPISWWSSSLTPTERWAEEARVAFDAGYRTHKIKAYPWMSLPTVVSDIMTEVATGYSLDLDFNGMLRTRGEALSVLTELVGLPGVGILESPCRMDAIADLAAVRQALPIPMAEHWRSFSGRPLLEADAVDGFVIADGGVTAMLHQLAVIEEFNKAGWLQMLGSDLTTAFAVHLSASSPAARWPAVTCSNLLEHSLVTTPLRVIDGGIDVPMEPGLGVSIDLEAVERYRVSDDAPFERSRVIVRVGDAAGEIRAHRSFRSAWIEARNIGWSQVHAHQPFVEVTADDGSTDFDRAWQSAAAWLPAIGGYEGFRP